MSERPIDPGQPPDPTSRAEGRRRAVEGILQTLDRSDRLQSGQKALAGLRAEHEPQSAGAQTEGRWRAVEAILRMLRRTDRLQAGEKALERLRSETGTAPATVRTDERTSVPYLHELMRRCVSGELGSLELDALQILMRCDPQARKELAQVCAELGRPVPAMAEEDGPQPATAPQALDRAPAGRPSSRRQAALPPPAARRFFYRRAWLSAAALLISATAGLVWLWSTTGNGSRAATVERQEAKRRREVLHRLAELDRQARELAAAERAVTRLPRPVPAPPQTEGEPSKTEEAQPARPVLTEEELARRREEAEKCTRLLEMRRLLLETELAGLKRPKAVAESDEEPDAPEDVVAAPAPPAPEVGRILFVEREAGKAVLLRGEEGARVELAAGTKLQSGDRIEVDRGGARTCASLELNSGATIDLAATTRVRVLDRHAVRLETGKIYACVAPVLRDDQDPEYAAPFSLETSAARYILQEARVEVNASPPISRPWTSARVDSGAVHVFNGRGHAMGRKGQEVFAGIHAPPVRRTRFRAPIWRGRDRPYRGLPFAKGHPLVISDEDTHQSFSAEYALALAHTGEIDLRGICVTQGAVVDPQKLWRKLMNEVAVLRRGGLRKATDPLLGALRPLRRPASGRYEDTAIERSKAAEHLLAAARAARPDRPLVVVASGAHTDLAGAWLLDPSISERVVVVTRTGLAAWEQDAWASTIVLDKFRCVICNFAFPRDSVEFSRLKGTRWHFLADRSGAGNTDFSQFACVTVPGFVQKTQRARFIRGKTPSDFRFEADPNGRTWLVKRAQRQRLAQEYEATFMQDAP